MSQPDCLLRRLETSSVRLQGDRAVAFFDAYPVTTGQTLIIHKRHVASLFESTEQEQGEVWRLAAEGPAMLLDEFRSNGFSIVFNDGAAAGQTVGHAHVHVIPRRHGDVADPRGGVRRIIPNKPAYWPGDRP